MKHIKRFNEAIVNHQSEDIDNFISILRNEGMMIPFERMVEIGEENNIEVVDYDKFYEDLPERDKSTAPPRQAPFFALVNPVTKRPRLVLQKKDIPRQMLNYIENVLHHEMIHVGQHSKRTIDKGLSNPTNSKSYFSDTDEIMAFAYSVAKELVDMSPYAKNASEIKDFGKSRLYVEIKKNVDIKVLNKYRKYIYLYLQDLLKA